jgi:hypothetical protein
MPDVEGEGINPGQMTARMIVGGIASKLGGGSFANGALTAAMEYLYNNLGGDQIENLFRSNGGHHHGVTLQSVKGLGAHIEDDAVRWASKQTIGEQELKIRKIDGKMPHTFNDLHRKSNAAVDALVKSEIEPHKKAGTKMNLEQMQKLHERATKLPEVQANNLSLQAHIARVRALRLR